MASRNAERLERYKEKMRAAGFKRLSVWVCPELARMLATERKQHECVGRTLERLLLGESRKRPPYRDATELSDHYAPAREGGNIAAHKKGSAAKVLKNSAEWSSVD